MARSNIVPVPQGIVRFRRILKRGPTWALGMAILACGAAFWSGCASTPVPADPVTSACSIGAPEFAGWFDPGSVTGGVVNLNGVANPADSLNFPDSPNCSFYKWSEQMFLWLTSPAPVTYGGGGFIFKSPAFYDVSPLDASFARTLIPHSAGFLSNLSLRAAQVGRQGLQVVKDKRGRLLEIEPPVRDPEGHQLVLDRQGRKVAVGRASLLRNEVPVFLDLAGKPIESPRPIFKEGRDLALTVQEFRFDKTPIFLDFAGAAVEVEQGQSDGSILMAQNGSLVYYGISVNDVYAYFLTGVKDLAFSATSFPTTPGNLMQVTTFATAHSKTFPDPNALAVEVKTAWVEATGLPDPNSYITMNATIPTYDTSNPDLWTPSGQKTVKLALVGIHVVGSTKGHPEMIWATFEHKSNSPSVTYPYLSTSGVKTVNPDFSQAWLFCAANPPAGARFNEPHMQQDSMNPDNIAAISPFHISPSNTMRVDAWGAAANASPNPIDAPSTPFATAASAASNSELISINNGVRGLLNSADVRKNYLLTGSTWTTFGDAPAMINFNFGNPGNTTIIHAPGQGRTVGTNQMSNTTMETYLQGSFTLPFASSFSANANNCFRCHDTNTTNVSHVFPSIKPLFP